MNINLNVVYSSIHSLCLGNIVNYNNVKKVRTQEFFGVAQ